MAFHDLKPREPNTGSKNDYDVSREMGEVLFSIVDGTWKPLLLCYLIFHHHALGDHFDKILNYTPNVAEETEKVEETEEMEEEE